ncbi:UDP-glucose 4-epimerase [Sphingomonas guangdongensis]|uniref:UDP-glucose 4-epimerase n=1 Tax=Sphingomonas guangdongensis TaxID=1141890 RepID=A0A285QHV8_9SPHN|nr:NAD-dependent epimerase/dehydratase family protein [Sphingomonas guangdongensis]SOB81098.1 UDP-glucose 4-epimerase [Sphingomonas guangdongensis]
MSIAGARCLVLGGGGFLGINLCRALLAAGAEVAGYGRRPHDRSALPSDLRWYDGDFADHAAIAQAVGGQDIVYHLLGGSVPAQSNAEPAADVVGSLLPSLRLIEACRAGGTGRLVFASSGGTVYGPTLPGIRITEDAPTNPITAYGINKLAVEKYLGLFRHLHGFDAVVLRVANPYGPFQHARRAQGVVGTALAHALAGEPIEIWGDGLVVRDYLHIDDVAAAMVTAGTYDGGQWLFNVGSGQGRTVRAVVEDVCALLGLPRDRIVHRPGRAVDVPYNVLNPDLIGREMGWAPSVDWQAGLVATARWLRERSAGRRTGA